ncbi:serine hydroxymethyltransferase, mitochondrial [Gossypium arboreum]|uniref:Serine hydroxymethyltransferase, mitochondrial n=1 Tax=Gossypium arboreum TaxID=29729 RepID=A0A0B0PRM9_GOSAR|nr:serine hydroxymethyltransferase, mitochondrial [Gossypium arboreum]KHG26061.1 serine hydroxymethyltransferase, mitochondrial [Gossypium arboreum]
MPCPRLGLTLAIFIEADAMSQTWSYTSSRMHVPDMSYTGTHLYADAMSQTWSYTGYRNVADACPRYVLH